MSKPLLQRLLELLSRGSLRTQYRIGNWLALVVGSFPNQVSRQTRHNLALCFPVLDPAERKRLYREVMRQICYSGTELGALWHWPGERVEQQITRVEVCEQFDQAEGGRIILAPHLGSWEALSVWCGNRFESMYLYKRRKNKKVDAYVKQARARTGGIPVPTKKHGLKQALVGLRKGSSLVILPDQKPSSNKARIPSEFFGLDAPTTTLVHSLCSRLDCPVFIAVVYRSSPPGEFSLHIESLDRERLAGDAEDSARYMNEAIEQRVRRRPEQYQWGYRRFSNFVYDNAVTS